MASGKTQSSVRLVVPRAGTFVRSYSRRNASVTNSTAMFDVVCISCSTGRFIHKVLPMGFTPNLLNRVHKLASYLRTALFWAITKRVVVINIPTFRDNL